MTMTADQYGGNMDYEMQANMYKKY